MMRSAVVLNGTAAVKVASGPSSTVSVCGGPTGSVSSSWSEVSKLTASPTSLTVVPAAFFCTSR